jgi:hypothetical protein
VQDRRDLLAQPLARAPGEPEVLPLDVTGHCAQTLVGRQPASGFSIVFGAHERKHVTIVALQKARQNLPAHESRGAGKQHGAHVTSLSRGPRG